MFIDLEKEIISDEMACLRLYWSNYNVCDEDIVYKAIHAYFRFLAFDDEIVEDDVLMKIWRNYYQHGNTLSATSPVICDADCVT